MNDIIVLGSANMDLVVRQPRLPRPGETMFGAEFTTVPGGKGLNQAVAAARAGASVSFLGAVGRDEFGSELRSCLLNDGIDVSGLQHVDIKTGTAHVSVLDGGENAIVVVPGANNSITALNDHAKKKICDARFLLAQFERPTALILEAFRIAKEAGVTTVLTPAPVREVDRELMQLVDVLIPNAQEACELAGIGDEDTAALELSRSVGLVIMTRGSRGALVAGAGEIVRTVPAIPARAVDTTAAGDTFVGALVAMMAEDMPLERALSAATAAASISVTREGASTSMPTRTEILDVSGLEQTRG
ncbi:ribokinase [Herbiconiux sp. CPCC 205716]|uniref:Ribokinase n=1 Tax=Herbiconiux gentiana TaxID=2970912 RepID=A0ABT2GMD6_9MICO|nr:ribokinase [Herbiconiux gentiana]MCS5716430.1 ribokinase [Herbiconiux gentiana]